MMSSFTCCFFGRRTKVNAAPTLVTELDEYTYLHLEMNRWTEKYCKQLYVDNSGQIELMAKTINLLLQTRIYTAATMPHHYQGITEESRVKIFATEEDAFQHAQERKQGVILRINYFKNTIDGSDITWIKSFTGQVISLPPTQTIIILTRPVALYQRSKFQTALSSLRQDLMQAAKTYLEKYPEPVIKWFYGSHTHQTAAKKLIKCVDQLAVNCTLEGYLQILTVYRKIYQSLSRGELSKSLQKTLNGRIFQSMRELLEEPVSDWRLDFSFNHFIDKIRKKSQLPAADNSPSLLNPSTF